MTGPLAGVLVADFSRVLAGPLATTTLADLGATVVKVEKPGTGDDTRGWGPPWVDAPGGTAAYFHAANRSKRSVVLDLADERDRSLAHELATRADVVVENFKHGTMERLGLGHQQVAASNPGVVYCSVTGFGSAGGADLPGYDFLVQALGGLMSITGAETGDPTKVGVAVVDVLTAKDAAIGILAALRAKEQSGLGQHVEVNLLSSLLGALANQTSSYLTTGQAPGRLGNAHPSIAPYQLLESADGPFAIACGNDAQFRRLSGALDLDALADDPRFATNAARVEHRAALADLLEARLSTAPAAHWVAALTQVGVPAGVVGDIGEAIALASSLGLEPTVEVGDDLPAQVRHPVTYSRTPVLDYQAPPRLGQHDDAIRAWLADPTKEIPR